jgi:hypothetical protein
MSEKSIPQSRDESLFLRDIVSKPFDTVTAVEFMTLWSIALRAVDTASERQDRICPKCGTETKTAREVVSANLMQALREQHRIDEAQRVCQHLWPHPDKPMPAKWDCACGARVYRSREDAIDD